MDGGVFRVNIIERGSTNVTTLNRKISDQLSKYLSFVTDRMFCTRRLLEVDACVSLPLTAMSPPPSPSSSSVTLDANPDISSHLSYPSSSHSVVSISTPPEERPRPVLKERLYVGNLHPSVDECVEAFISACPSDNY